MRKENQENMKSSKPRKESSQLADATNRSIITSPHPCPESVCPSQNPRIILTHPSLHFSAQSGTTIDRIHYQNLLNLPLFCIIIATTLVKVCSLKQEFFFLDSLYCCLSVLEPEHLCKTMTLPFLRLKSSRHHSQFPLR